MWGWSPGDGTFGTGTMQYLKHAKKQGARIICVDPRVTNTSKQLADEHVFIRPSTDAAALIAMAYVIVSKTCTTRLTAIVTVLGLDEGPVPQGASYRSYLLGEADGQPKSPEWAAAITGIPAENDPPPGDRIRHRQTRRAFRLAMPPAAPSTASNSTAPPTPSLPSPATSASLAAIQVSVMAPLDGQG